VRKRSQTNVRIYLHATMTKVCGSWVNELVVLCLLDINDYTANK